MKQTHMDISTGFKFTNEKGTNNYFVNNQEYDDTDFLK